MKLSIRLGALAPKIKEQLDSEGITDYDEICLDVFQKDADAISRLSIRGLIPESIAVKARVRLMKKLAKWLNERP